MCEALCKERGWQLTRGIKGLETQSTSCKIMVLNAMLSVPFSK